MSDVRRTITAAAAGLLLALGAAAPADAARGYEKVHTFYWTDYASCHSGFLSAYDAVRAEGRRVLRNEGICQPTKTVAGGTRQYYVRLISVSA